MGAHKEKEIRYINPFTGAFFIPTWLLMRPEVSQGAKLCYGRLCQYADKKECFPTQSDLANELGLKTRLQVIRYIGELKSLKLIVAVKSRLQGRNVYKFLYHEWMCGFMPNVQDTAEV